MIATSKIWTRFYRIWDEEETEASASDDDAELEIGEQDLDAIESAYREGELLDEDEEGVEVEEGFEAEFEAGELFEAPGDTARPPEAELTDSGKEDTLAEFTLAPRSRFPMSCCRIIWIWKAWTGSSSSGR